MLVALPVFSHKFFTIITVMLSLDNQVNFYSLWLVNKVFFPSDALHSCFILHVGKRCQLLSSFEYGFFKNIFIVISLYYLTLKWGLIGLVWNHAPPIPWICFITLLERACPSYRRVQQVALSEGVSQDIDKSETFTKPPYTQISPATLLENSSDRIRR